jgi:hypothetical protein
VHCSGSIPIALFDLLLLGKGGALDIPFLVATITAQSVVVVDTGSGTQPGRSERTDFGNLVNHVCIHHNSVEPILGVKFEQAAGA